MSFNKGFYAYVGSALNGLESRVARHLRKSKKQYWHIDYLLDRAIIIKVILIPGEERLECVLARTLGQRLRCVPRFGSSDCNCSGHLFFAANKSKLEAQVLKILTVLDFHLLSPPRTCPQISAAFNRESISAAMNLWVCCYDDVTEWGCEN